MTPGSGTDRGPRHRASRIADRPTGIPLLGSVPWGTHLCQFYSGVDDLKDILVPYFKAGLENNEFCMWVTAEPLGAEEARAALGEAIGDLAPYLETGQLLILPHEDWYLRGGSFDHARTLSGWVQMHDRALAHGFDGMRLTGNTFWLEKEGWQDFTEYEAAIDGVIGDYRMIAI